MRKIRMGAFLFHWFAVFSSAAFFDGDRSLIFALCALRSASHQYAPYIVGNLLQFFKFGSLAESKEKHAVGNQTAKDYL